ncbi:hypothetical protein M0R72_21445 [Candidatus Pacearchaeota archaeon]|jgi:adenine/guanine phosphoribosyltransferase-like PRPP-binding protein|nr:hypothetical protein [Candidatus Pacearchaeota archaeon]
MTKDEIAALIARKYDLPMTVARRAWKWSEARIRMFAATYKRRSFQNIEERCEPENVVERISHVRPDMVEREHEN